MTQGQFVSHKCCCKYAIDQLIHYILITHCVVNTGVSQSANMLIGRSSAVSLCTKCMLLNACMHAYYYSSPVGVWSIVINPSVRESVCLSASISLEPLDRPSRNFVRRFPMPVAQSSSGDVVICYVFPVLRMTSRLAVMGRIANRGWWTVTRTRLPRVALRDPCGVWCLRMPCSPKHAT